MNTLIRRASVLAVIAHLVGSLAVLAAPERPTTKRPLRVYVFTQEVRPGNPVPPDQKARQDSVTDLKTSLARRRQMLASATAPEKADLTLEVLGREFRETGEVVTLFPKFGGDLGPAPFATPARRAFVFVRVNVVGRASSVNIVGGGPGWTYAAEGALQSVEKWFNGNDDKLERRAKNE
jgi:hypothetical protein